MICEVCKKSRRTHCTNGRCRECHTLYCTPGGSTSPGHGRRWPARRVWRVWDPQIGVSLWSNERDARAVARHRRAVCTVEEVEAQAGDLVSTLGAPDERVRRD